MVCLHGWSVWLLVMSITKHYGHILTCHVLIWISLEREVDFLCMTIFVIVSNKFTGSYSSYLLESAGKVDSPADKRWKIWDHDINGDQREEGKFQIGNNTGKIFVENHCRKTWGRYTGCLNWCFVDTLCVERKEFETQKGS